MWLLSQEDPLGGLAIRFVVVQALARSHVCSNTTTSVNSRNCGVNVLLLFLFLMVVVVIVIVIVIVVVEGVTRVPVWCSVSTARRRGVEDQRTRYLAVQYRAYVPYDSYEHSTNNE
jgi:uncharacterized protein HemY